MKHHFYVEKVVEKKHKQDFHNCCISIYRHFAGWISPLHMTVENIFNSKKNFLFEEGGAERWVLYDDKHEAVGRIAAFYHPIKFTDDNANPVGAMGFFECLEEYGGAKLLFETAEQWLKEKGFEQYLAPVNFGETDVFWGLLTEGYDRTPTFGMNYNPQYYVTFFEQFGFQKKYDQFSSVIWVRDGLPERFAKVSRWVEKRNKLTFKYLDYKHLDSFVQDFITIYNDAWSDFQNFTPQTFDKALEEFKKFKPLVDKKLIWFAYVDGVPASFIMGIKDGNEIIYDFNGKLTFRNKIRFLIRQRKLAKRMRLVVMGTRKEYQKIGLDAVLFNKIAETGVNSGHYELAELSWVGDFNKEMMSLHEATESIRCKRHSTFVKDLS